MHIYDPNGAIKAYRQERERRENWRTILFCVATGIGVIGLYALLTVIVSMVEGGRS